MRAFFSFAVALLMLSACGSGGSSSPTPLANPNGGQYQMPAGSKWSASDFASAVNCCISYYNSNYPGQYSSSALTQTCVSAYSQYAVQMTFQQFVQTNPGGWQQTCN